jgi:hypothetical protein
MTWIKLSGFAPMMAAALIVAPATAYADPVPTTDEVVAVLAELTDPNIPAANKTNIVTPGFSPDEAGTIDDHLNRMNAPQFALLPPTSSSPTSSPHPTTWPGPPWRPWGGIATAPVPSPSCRSIRAGTG